MYRGLSDHWLNKGLYSSSNPNINGDALYWLPPRIARGRLSPRTVDDFLYLGFVAFGQ
jgi:hypothetical protein